MEDDDDDHCDSGRRALRRLRAWWARCPSATSCAGCAARPESEGLMETWMQLVLVLGAWWALQAFVLPRLGVPT